jgi:hypothetical protein
MTENVNKVLGDIRKWEPENLYTKSYITGESFLDAYVRSLCMNLVRERTQGVFYPTLKEWKDIFMKKISLATGFPNSDVVTDLFIYLIHQAVKGKTLITLKEGYIGVGPVAAQYGKKLGL